MRTGKLLIAVLAVCAGMLSSEAQTVIADFSGDFARSLGGDGMAYTGTEVPNTGWSYLYSTNGIGSSNYLSMVVSTTISPETWVTPGGDPANMTVSYGSGTWQAGTGVDLRSIAAYEIQSGEEGAIAVANSTLNNPFLSANLDVLVYVNDRFVRRVEARGVTTTFFDCPLGNLVAGDVVYVLMDGLEAAIGDKTAIDYQLVKDDTELVYYATASATNVYYKNDVTFNWGIALDADSMTVTPAIGGTTDLLALTTNGVGTIDAEILSNTTYTVTVDRGIDTTNLAVNIVLDPMSINAFAASPASAYIGDEIELLWDVGGAESIVISNATGSVLSTNVAAGTLTLMPPQGTNTYTLTASNSGGEVETSAPLVVVVDGIRPSGLIVDSAFTNGDYSSNGSFEYDAAGNLLVGGTIASPGTPGLWVHSGTTATLTIDGTDSIVGVSSVRAINDSGASDGNHALQVRAGPVHAGSYGGFLNTGYTVGDTDEFTLSFDWTITGNVLGASNFEVYVFTSSDNTLGGTLTSLGSTRISQGGAVSGFQAVSLTNLVPNTENVGQQLWVSVTPDGFTANALLEKPVVDNINLIQTTVYPTPAQLSIGFNAGQLSITAGNMASGAINTLQGSVSLIPVNWVDLDSSTGFEEVTWPISESETNRVFRVESN